MVAAKIFALLFCLNIAPEAFHPQSTNF